MKEIRYYANEADVVRHIYFQKDYELLAEPSFHDSVEFIFILKGEVEAHCNNSVRLVTAGDIIFAESYATHYYIKKSPKVLAYVLVLAREYTSDFRAIFPNHTIDAFLTDKEINKPIFKHVEKWCERETKSYLYNIGCATELFALLTESYPTIKRKDYEGDALIKKMLRYIHTNYTKPISLQSIAKEFGYSVEYCCKTLKRVTKCNFKQYVNMLRLRKANDLLADKSLNYTRKEVACMAGFNSLATYYRVKKEFDEKENNKNELKK